MYAIGRVIDEPKVGIGCIVCGESVILELHEALSMRSNIKICDKCKAAIMYARKQMEEAGVE